MFNFIIGNYYLLYSERLMLVSLVGFKTNYLHSQYLED